MSRSRAWLGIGLGLVAATVFAACGSSDGKKRVAQPEGGAGGETSAEAGSGGSGTPASGAPGELGGAAPNGNGGEPAGSAGDDGTGTAGYSGAGTAGDSGSSQAGAAGQGGAGSGNPGYTIAAYVSPTGNDTTGDGTEGNPFKTLTPAAVVAQSGEAIVLMDGTHIVDYFVSLPEGVALVAQNPGQTTLGQMPNFTGGVTFQGSATLDGLKLGYTPNTFRVSTGTLNVQNTAFGAHGDGSGNDATIVATGSAHVVLTPPSPDYHWFHEPSGGRVIQMSDSSTLEVNGGIFDNCSTHGSLFLVYSGAAQLSLSDVTVANCPVGNVVVLANGGISVDTSVLHLNNVTIQNSGTASGIRVGWGTPEVYIVDSTIDTAGGYGLYIEGENTQGAGVQKVRIETSTITGNAIGIYSYYYSKMDLGLLDVDVVSNGTGIQLKFTDVDYGNLLDIQGGSIANNTSYGLDALNETNKPIKLKLRGTSVSGNGNHGLYLGGNGGSMYDLGTELEAGGNTFDNPGTSNNYAGILVNAPNIVKAVGNTWIANHQGASLSGKYVPATGNYTEVAGPVASGNNYRISTGAQKLWL